MRWLHTVPFMLAIAGAACASGTSTTEGGAAGTPVVEGPPIPFNLPRDAVPPSGLCRIWIGGNRPEQQPLPQGCEGIEHLVPTGEYVLYRPRGSAREVHVCYMSSNQQGVVDGIDVFDIGRNRLVRVLVPKQRRTAENSPRCAS